MVGNNAGDLFLRIPYSPTISPGGVLTPGVIDVYQSFKRRVAPLEHVVHPEGHVAQENGEWRVAPLEHVVCPEGHVAQRNR